jgi:hypothetical protein
MVACFGVGTVQVEAATIRNHNPAQSECLLHGSNEAAIKSSFICHFATCGVSPRGVRLRGERDNAPVHNSTQRSLSSR